MSNPGPRQPPPQHRVDPPGRRARPARRRARLHRADSLAGTLGLTALGTLLPGSGILLAGRRGLGLAVLLVALGLAALAGFAATQESTVLAAAVDPDKLLAAAAVASVLLLALVAVSVVTYRMVRRAHAPRGERLVEAAFVVVLCLLVAAPFAVGARYAFVQRDLVRTVFAGESEVAVDEEQPWGEDDRVNVLLLGGDGGVHRIGIRTDTVMLASMDASTGDTVLFSLPRNLQNVPFPPGSALAELYPDGFDGAGDPLEWMLNAVYGKVPELHPDLLEGSANEGAEAVKQAVSGALGIPVDYYILINLKGFQEVVDAVGGITVNINQPIPIGGNTDLGVPPEDYLDPGPSQHLDGFEALWFARGRYGLDDYDRMERQRCVVDALMDEVDPLTLLRRYEALAAAGKEIVRTDIPQNLVPAFVELGMELRGGEPRSVVFQPTERFDPNDPDYAWMRRKVQRVLAAGEQTAGDKPPARVPAGPSGGAGPTDEPEDGRSTGTEGRAGSGAPADSPTEESDACSYHPTG